jgi:Tol biopolymer transport system component
VVTPQHELAETGSIGDIETICVALGNLGHEGRPERNPQADAQRTPNAEPAWSPDGRKIAFRSTRNGNRDIYVMNADGSGKRNLTRNAASDSRPSWSPDGRKIAFVSNRDGRLEAHVMNADGSGQRSLAGSEER